MRAGFPSCTFYVAERFPLHRIRGIRNYSIFNARCNGLGLKERLSLFH